MDTRKIATEYRLTHWAQIMRERHSSDESAKAYCERLGIHENVYYYWQRKLRESACRELLPAGQETVGKSVVPNGWTVCKSPVAADAKTIIIEIGKSRITATEASDIELLAKVCRMLTTLC